MRINIKKISILKTIAIIESDPAIRDSMNLLLHDCGYELEIYSSLLSFFYNFRQQELLCLILSLNTKEQNKASLQRLSERLIETPILLLLNRKNRQLHNELVKTLKFEEAIYKPINASLLLECIEGFG